LTRLSEDGKFKEDQCSPPRDGSDMVAIRNQLLGLLGAVPTIFGDTIGDGTVDINDYTAV